MTLDTPIPLSEYIKHAYNCNPAETVGNETAIAGTGYGVACLMTVYDDVCTIKIHLEKYMLERKRILEAVEKFELDHRNRDDAPRVHIQIIGLKVI